MFQLIRAISGLDLAVRQLPLVSVSFVIATLFYTFHNFALEAGAFLVTWFVLDALAQVVLTLLARLRVAVLPPA